MHEDREIKNLIFIDCEANGKCPSLGKLTEFGAVAHPSKSSFHGILIERRPSEENPKLKVTTGKTFDERQVFEKFENWLIHEVSRTAANFPSTSFRMMSLSNPQVFLGGVRITEILTNFSVGGKFFVL